MVWPMAEHANPFGYLFIEPFLNLYGRDRIPTCGLNDRHGPKLPVPHSDSHGYDGRLNNVQAGKHRAHDLCIVRMVPTSTVPFLPEIFAESLAPSGDFAVSIGFCSYFVCRRDECGSHAVESRQIHWDTHRTAHN